VSANPAPDADLSPTAQHTTVPKFSNANQESNYKKLGIIINFVETCKKGTRIEYAVDKEEDGAAAAGE
jgi:hypothetical protein